MAPGASLLAALQLNHHGTNLLETGDYQSACMVFCTAMKVARAQTAIDAILDHPNENESNEDIDSSSSDESSTCCSSSSSSSVDSSYYYYLSTSDKSTSGESESSPERYHPTDEPKHPRAITRSTCRVGKEEEVFTSDFIFRRPACVSMVVPNDDSVSTMAVSCAILFNLGLAQHLRAMKALEDGIVVNKKESRRRLLAALQVYEMVYALQETGGTSSTGSYVTADGQLPYIHILGLVNNCAQIHKLMNQDDRGDSLFHHLLTSLMMVVSSTEEDEDDSLQFADLEGFFASTSYLILRESCAAEAA